MTAVSLVTTFEAKNKQASKQINKNRWGQGRDHERGLRFVVTNGRNIPPVEKETLDFF